MRIMLFLLVFVLVRIRISTQQPSGVDDITSVLDKLIYKANETSGKITGETPDIPESFFPIPFDSTKATGNDSNIYYFKTYMAPRIKFKSSSETLRVVHRSNKTTRNFSRTHEALSEDELIPGTPKNGSTDTAEQRHSRESPINEDSDPISQNNFGNEDDRKSNMADNLRQKDTRRKATTEASPFPHISGKPLSLIHDYPELVLDRMTSNNKEDKDDFGTRKKNSKRVPERRQSVLRYSATPRSVYPERSQWVQDSTARPEYEEITEIVEMVKEEKKDSSGENEARRQSELLEKILENLIHRQPDIYIPEAESRVAYPIPHPIPINTLPVSEIETIPIPVPTYLQNVQQNVVNRLSTAYLSPVLTPRRVPIVPYLAGGLVSPARNRIISSFVRRPMSRYTYRPAVPVLYGLY